MSSIVPSNLLHISYTFKDIPSLVWYTEPCTRNHIFTKETNIRDGIRPVPWLVWKNENSVLSLYACTEKPTLKSVLYKAPYFNVNDSVCLGGATRYVKKKASSFQEVMTHFEKLFWFSAFSSITDEDGVFKGNLSTWYNFAVPTDSFPYDRLITTRKTVTSLCTK